MRTRSRAGVNEEVSRRKLSSGIRGIDDRRDYGVASSNLPSSDCGMLVGSSRATDVGKLQADLCGLSTYLEIRSKIHTKRGVYDTYPGPFHCYFLHM